MDLKLDSVPLTHECLGKCVQRRAFFIEFSLGGQCPKRALQMVKKGTLRIINACLHRNV